MYIDYDPLPDFRQPMTTRHLLQIHFVGVQVLFLRREHLHATGEAMLRKRIQELQHYRRMGLVSAADIEKYEIDVAKRVRLSVLRSLIWY